MKDSYMWHVVSTGNFLVDIMWMWALLPLILAAFGILGVWTMYVSVFWFSHFLHFWCIFNTMCFFFLHASFGIAMSNGTVNLTVEFPYIR